MTEPPAQPPQQPDPYGPPTGYGSEPRYDTGPQSGSGYGAPSGSPYGYGSPSPYGSGPQPAYGAQPPGHGGPSGAPGLSITALLGTRARVRPSPRFTPSLAGAGALLALFGAAVWSIAYLARGFGVDFGSDDGSVSTHGTGRRFLGVVVFLVLTALGYALVVLNRRGPAASGGAALSAFGVPLALGFTFLDLSGTGGFPLNVDAVFLLSILVWLVSYLVVPGARGRALYLGASALALPTYILVRAAGTSVASAGFSAVSGNGFTSGSSGGDTGTVATITLVFGLGYYAVAALLDRAGRPGVAVALLPAALLLTASGIGDVASDAGAAGTGVILVLISLAVMAYAGRAGRRFTAWAWAVGLVLGVTLIVDRVARGHTVTIGVVLFAVGVLLVAVTPALQKALREPPDLVEPATPGGQAPGAR